MPTLTSWLDKLCKKFLKMDLGLFHLRYDSKTDKLGLSTTQFKTADLNILGKIIVKIVSMLRIGYVQTKKIDKDEYTEMSNLTLINFVIFVFGPMHEKRVTQVLMMIQVLIFITFCITFSTKFLKRSFGLLVKGLKSNLM